MMQINDELLDIEGIKKSNKNLLDLFIRRTAVLTSTQEHLVEKIIKDQWKNANKVSQPGSPISEIDFCNIGTFFISGNKSKKRIAKNERFIKDTLVLPQDKKTEAAIKKSQSIIDNIKSKVIK